MQRIKTNSPKFLKFLKFPKFPKFPKNNLITKKMNDKIETYAGLAIVCITLLLLLIDEIYRHYKNKKQ
jgi:hypothetical protein